MTFSVGGMKQWRAMTILHEGHEFFAGDVIMVRDRNEFGCGGRMPDGMLKNPPLLFVVVVKPGTVELKLESVSWDVLSVLSPDKMETLLTQRRRLAEGLEAAGRYGERTFVFNKDYVNG